ncbi:MAG: hypothetical protein M1343_03010 [Chloroflexi bacterium]|nr:hypothetical protein [Chloroflexota bacterium]MDA8187149.1 hypothetical protein [Dehalococcoidales bacterium]
MSPHVLVVQESVELATFLYHFLSYEGHECTLAIQVQEAVDLLRTRKFDLIITDSFGFSVRSSCDLAPLQPLLDNARQTPLILFSTWDVDVAIARQANVFTSVVQQPLEIDELARQVNAALEETGGGQT